MPDITVEIVFQHASQQHLESVVVPLGATVADVVRASTHDGECLSVGIWGREVAPTDRVDDGDRIEVYRPLQREPREARRQLALTGKTMDSIETD